MLAEEKKDIEKNVAKEDVPDEPPCPYWLMMIPYFLTFVFFTFFSSSYRCQISLLYSSMVLSEEKYPAFPIFTSIFSAHAVLSS